MNPLTKILIGIGLALTIIIALFIFYLLLVNAHLKTQIAQTQANATACHIANDDFATQILGQNNAVENLKRNSLQREKQAQDAAQAARKQAEIYQQQARKIAGQKPGKDICAASEKLFNDYLKANP